MKYLALLMLFTPSLVCAGSGRLDQTYTNVSLHSALSVDANLEGSNAYGKLKFVVSDTATSLNVKATRVEPQVQGFVGNFKITRYAYEVKVEPAGPGKMKVYVDRLGEITEQATPKKPEFPKQSLWSKVMNSLLPKNEINIVVSTGDITLTGSGFVAIDSVDIAIDSVDIEIEVPTKFAGALQLQASDELSYTGVDSNQLNSALIKTSSADMDIQKLRTKDSLKIQSSAGRIKARELAGADTQILTSSGDMELEKINAKFLRVSSTSGELMLTEADADTLTLQTTSGGFDLADLNGKLTLTTVSGEVSLRALSQTSAFNPRTAIHSSSGDMTIQGLITTGSLDVSTDCGKLKLTEIDAPFVQIRTNSGDVTIQTLQGNVDLKGSNSQVDLSNVRGKTHRIQTTSGDVSANTINGNLQFETRNGLVTLKKVNGDQVQVTTSSGDVEVDDVRANLQIETQIGTTQVHDFTGRSHTFKSTSGDMTLRRVNGDVFARSRSGNIDVRNSSGILDIESDRGDVSYDDHTGDVRAIGDDCNHILQNLVNGSSRRQR